MSNTSPVHDAHALDADQVAYLTACARRYIWWQTHEQSLKSPDRVILQIMEIGEAAHMLDLPSLFDHGVLFDILKGADTGVLSPPSWTYWHARLGWPIGTPVPVLPSARRAS